MDSTVNGLAGAWTRPCTRPHSGEHSGRIGFAVLLGFLDVLGVPTSPAPANQHPAKVQRYRSAKMLPWGLLGIGFSRLSTLPARRGTKCGSQFFRRLSHSLPIHILPGRPLSRRPLTRAHPASFLSTNGIQNMYDQDETNVGKCGHSYLDNGCLFRTDYHFYY